MFLKQKQQTNNYVRQPEFIPYDVMSYVKLQKASKNEYYTNVRYCSLVVNQETHVALMNFHLYLVKC